jgi:hypothetical protein
VALYTNETQEGILQSNDLPPRAMDIAWHSGRMFYVNTKGAHQGFLNLIDVSGDIVSAVNTTGLQERTFTGTVSGVNNITEPRLLTVSPSGW